MERCVLQIAKIINQLNSDESGAALIEYTVLLVILLVGVLVIIAGVGKWVSGEWASLSAAL
jgi:Flp pilus assembly pilin Flp